jgi:hypothetical protein
MALEMRKDDVLHCSERLSWMRVFWDVFSYVALHPRLSAPASRSPLGRHTIAHHAVASPGDLRQHFSRIKSGKGGHSGILCDSFNQDYAACAVTCRLLSSLARPLLFRTVTLLESGRAEELAELINTEVNIARWIRDLTIRTGLLWDINRGRSLCTLQIWLSSDTGVKLVD